MNARASVMSPASVSQVPGSRARWLVLAVSLLIGLAAVGLGQVGQAAPRDIGSLASDAVQLARVGEKALLSPDSLRSPLSLVMLLVPALLGVAVEQIVLITQLLSVVGLCAIALALWDALGRIGAGRGFHWLLLVSFLASPLVIGEVSRGSSSLLAIGAWAWAAAFLLRWRLEDEAVWLSASSVLAALACAGRVELLLPSLAVALGIAWTPARSEAGGAEISAQALAYATPVVGAAVFLLLAGVLTVGDPLRAIAGYRPDGINSPLDPSNLMRLVAPLVAILFALWSYGRSFALPRFRAEITLLLSFPFALAASVLVGPSATVGVTLAWWVMALAILGQLPSGRAVAAAAAVLVLASVVSYTPTVLQPRPPWLVGGIVADDFSRGAMAQSVRVTLAQPSSALTGDLS